MSILVIVSGIISGIIYSTLRGSSKTKISTEVTQNGGYATTIIAGIISDSRNVAQINGSDLDDCTSVPPPSTDNITPTPLVNRPSITLRRIDGSKTILSCGYVNNVYTITSNGVSLLNTNNVKADVNTCLFSCTQVVSDPYSIPVVNVSFNVHQVSAGLFENQSSASFSTSTSLRVYSP